MPTVQTLAHEPPVMVVSLTTQQPVTVIRVNGLLSAHLPSDGGETDTIAMATVNSDDVTISAGMAVCMAANGVGVVRASRDNIARQAIGVAKTTAAPTGNLSVVLLGICEVDDWTLSTGGAWLPPATRMWLALNGLMSSTPGAIASQYHQSIGAVIAPQKIVVAPSRAVILT